MADGDNDSGVKYLGDQGSDGTVLGTSTASLIGFLGVSSPVSRQTTYTAVTTQAATSTTPYGFATTTQANGITTALASIKTALDAFGLMG